LDATLADGLVTLAKFLRNDDGGHFGVQEAMANNLADHFVGAAVVSFGAAALVLESGGAAVLKARQQLVVAGAGEAVFLGGGTGA
jgi:hypothetical protein